MDAPVIVVGGGPVGLALALGLGRYGVRSILLEKERQGSTQSRALALWPRTLEHLQDWGAAEELRAAGVFRSRLDVYDAACHGAAKALIAVDFDVIADILDRPGALVIPQYDTERILRDRVLAEAACDVRTGCEAIGVEQDADGVTVHLRGGNGDRTLRAAYAVACDGAESFVRRSLGFTVEALAYGARAVLSDDVLGGDDPSGPMLRLASKHAGFLFAMRFATDTWRIVASIPEDVEDADALSEAAHAARVHALFGDGVVYRTAWKQLFPLHRRRAARFTSGRVALAGDAAHALSAAGGEGLNAGIADAANLAWKLAYATQGRADASLLMESYDLERRLTVADTIERTGDTVAKFTMDTHVWVRSMALSLMARALRGRGMQRKAARGLGLLSGRIGKSPIVDARHPLAGRRLDDLQLPDGTRVHAERAGRAVAVAVGDVRVEEFEAIALPRAPKRWCIKGPAVVIVRPDGVVAAVIEKPTQRKVSDAWSLAFAAAG